MDLIAIIVLIGFVVLLIVILALVIWLVNFLGINKESGEVVKHLTEIANQLGWKYDERKKRFEGLHQGRKVTVDQFDPSLIVAGEALLVAGLVTPLVNNVARGLIRSGARLKMAVRIPSKGYMSMVSRRSVSTFDTLLYGRGRTGFEDVDRQFTVESKPREFAANVLASKDLQDQILEAAKARPLSIVVKKSQINMQVEDLEISEAAILAIAEIASGIADAAEATDF